MTGQTPSAAKSETTTGQFELDHEFRFSQVDPWVAALFESDVDTMIGEQAEIALGRLSGDLRHVQMAIDGTGPPDARSTLTLTGAKGVSSTLRTHVQVTRDETQFLGLRMHFELSRPAEATPTRKPTFSSASDAALVDQRQPGGDLVNAIQRFGSRFDFHAMAAFRVSDAHLSRVALWIAPSQQSRMVKVDEQPQPVTDVFQPVMDSRSSGPQLIEGLDPETLAALLGLRIEPGAAMDVLATRLELPDGGVLLGIRDATDAYRSLNFQRTIRDLSWLVTQLVARREAEEALTTQLQLQERLRAIATRFLSTAPHEKSQTLREALWQLGTSMQARRLTVWQCGEDQDLHLEAQYASGEWPIVSRRLNGELIKKILGDQREPMNVLASDLPDFELLTTRGENALQPGDRLTIVPLGDERQVLGYMFAIVDSPTSRSAAHASGLNSLGSLLASFLMRIENEERFERAFTDGPIPVTWRRLSGELLQCNNAFLNFVGRDSEYALLGTTPDAVVDTSRISTSAVMRQLESPNPTEVPFLRSDGSIAWGRVVNFRVRQGGETIILSHIADTTASHEITQQLQHQATHDELTGLKNRRGLLEELDTLPGVDFTSESAAVLLIDVDRFKVVNDSLGHAAGDQLLLELAQRLAGAVAATDICARLGGDEFVVVLRGPVDETAAIETANRLLSGLSGSVQLGEHEVFTSISIGIAFPHPDDSGASDLLRHADAAMYEAKNNGRNCFATFDQRTRDVLASRSAAETELRRAIDNGELVPWYQPEYDLLTGSIVGVEALVRWPHPTRGILSGDDIIPLAEETGLIGQLGTHIIERACADAAIWSNRLGSVPFGLRVNVSASQLDSYDVIDMVVASMMKSNLDPTQLCLEVTETALMRDPKQALRILNILVRELGLSIAVDDFGTGFSSLAYLKRLPVRTLKIDREFVSDLGTNDENTAIVKTVVALAESLRLEVVAEGIEDEAARQRLLTLGVTRGQGYFLARPMPHDEITELLFPQELARSTAGLTDGVRPGDTSGSADDDLFFDLT